MPMLEGFRFMRGEGSGELDGSQTKTRAHTRVYLGSPPEGKDLHPACLTLY
jgi:hypothetical protein